MGRLSAITVQLELELKLGIWLGSSNNESLILEINN